MDLPSTWEVLSCVRVSDRWLKPVIFPVVIHRNDRAGQTVAQDVGKIQPVPGFHHHGGDIHRPAVG